MHKGYFYSKPRCEMTERYNDQKVANNMERGWYLDVHTVDSEDLEYFYILSSYYSWKQQMDLFFTFDH